MAITELTRLLMRRRSAAEWNALNEVLMNGEIGVVTDSVPMKLKIGNGVSAWSDLPFIIDNDAIQIQIASLSNGQINAVIGVAPPANVIIANVSTPGTYPEYGGLIVSAEDLSSGFVQFRKSDGVWTKYITPIDLSAYLKIDDNFIDKYTNILTPISIGNQFLNATKWAVVPTATLTRIANGGYFANGNYYDKISTSGSSAIGCDFRTVIPEQYRVIGMKYRIYFTYKSNSVGTFKLHLRSADDTAWINLAASPTFNIVNTSGIEKTGFIERSYEENAGFCSLYLSAFGTSHILEIGGISVYVAGSSLPKKIVDVSTEVPYGTNPAYETINPWQIGTLAGTSTLEFLNNAGDFTIGNKYVKFSAIGGGATNSFVKMELPNEFKGDTSKVARLRFAYRSEGTGSAQYNIYQRNLTDTAWTVNNYVAVTMPKTFLDEGFIQVDVPIAANTGYIVLVEQLFNGGILKIGSIRGSILSSVKPPSASIKTTKIVVNAAGGGDFTSLRAALKSISSVSETNKYYVFIKNGTYNEIDITGAQYYGSNKDLVIVEGESRDGVIIRTDGKSTALSPTGYSYPVTPAGSYDNVPINTIPQSAKHGFYIQETVTFKNLTVYSNDVKYCVHQDNTNNAYDSLFENCRFIHEETTSTTYYYCVGVGSRDSQRQRYTNCIFEARLSFSTNEVAAIFWHNWNNRIGPTYLDIKDCEVLNAHILHASELGSNQNDIVTVERCKTNVKDKGIIYSLTPGFYTPTPATPADYPYNIQMSIIDSKINYFELRDERSGAAYKAVSINDYHFLVRNNSGSTILRGTPVKIDWTNVSTSNMFIKKSIDVDYDFICFADIPDSSNGFAAPRGKSVKGLLIAGAYLRGDLLKINSSGKFEKTTVLTEKSATVMDNITLTSDGLAIILT